MLNTLKALSRIVWRVLLHIATEAPQVDHNTSLEEYSK